MPRPFTQTARARPLAVLAAALALGSCAGRADPFVLGLQFPLTDGAGQPDL